MNSGRDKHKEGEMRTFGTRGTVQPDQHYVVARTAEVKDFINRRLKRDGTSFFLRRAKLERQPSFDGHSLRSQPRIQPTFPFK